MKLFEKSIQEVTYLGKNGQRVQKEQHNPSVAVWYERLYRADLYAIIKEKSQLKHTLWPSCGLMSHKNDRVDMWSRGSIEKCFADSSTPHAILVRLYCSCGCSLDILAIVDVPLMFLQATQSSRHHGPTSRHAKTSATTKNHLLGLISLPETLDKMKKNKTSKSKRTFRHGELNPGLLGPSCAEARFESEKS